MEEQQSNGITKKFMCVNRRAPYGTIYALESLEVVLIAAAFEQDISLVFMDDGVYQLMKAQDTAAIGVKNFSPAYSALGDYDVKKIYIESDSLKERGLSEDKLLALSYEDEDDDWKEKSSVRIVGRDELAKLMSEQDVVLSF